MLFLWARPAPRYRILLQQAAPVPVHRQLRRHPAVLSPRPRRQPRCRRSRQVHHPVLQPTRQRQRLLHPQQPTLACQWARKQAVGLLQWHYLEDLHTFHKEAWRTCILFHKEATTEFQIIQWKRTGLPRHKRWEGKAGRLS